MAKRKATAKTQAKPKAKAKSKTSKGFPKNWITLYDENGNLRMLFSLSSIDGCPQIALYGDDGCERLVLGIHKDNTPFINLRNADRESAGVALDSDGHIQMGISSEKCFPCYKEYIHPSGERHCEAIDANGRATYLRRTPTSGAEILSGPPKATRRKTKRDN